MSIEIKVPPLGESVTEATVARWYKKPGEAVHIDEVIVELETDKVSMEVNAPSAGILEKINVEEGGTIEVGGVLGAINEQAAISEPANLKVAKAVSVVNNEPNKPDNKTMSDQEKLSPASRKMVAEHNLDVNQIQASGKDGRVTKGDVISYLETPIISAPSSKLEERVRMSRLRKRIAERLKESQNNAAILTTFNEADMSQIMEIRAKYRDIFEKKHGIKLGFMSFFVKAVIQALKDVPSVNAEIDGEDIIYKNYFDIGVAVGTEQGLVVPIVKNADHMSFADVEKTIVNLGKKARDGKLSMQDLTGGTFTISNGGTYGSLLSTPIINPPQSGILGMHKIQERAMVIDGKIEIRPMMYLALSYDHRIIDGKEAVTFLVKVKEAIESPERLLFNI